VKICIQTTLITIGFSLALPAQAQLDPTTSVLLRPSGKNSGQPSLESSRYKVRTPESRKEDDLSETPGTLIPSAVPTRESRKSRPVEKPNAVTEATVINTARESSTNPAPETAATTPTPDIQDSPPPVTVQVRELIFGGRDEDIQEARAQIQPEDPRHNIVSVSIAPAYFYTASNSSYSYRNYNSHGPGFALGMNVWLTPFMGLQSRYFSSVSSGVRDGALNTVEMDTQEFEAGIRFRKHFGYSLKSAQLNWGIDYHDASNKVAREATTLVGRKTSGLSLALEAIIPTSVSYAHLLDVRVRPMQHHSESQTTVTAKSGTKNETNGLALAVGGQWTLDRRNQLFWKSQYSVERNLFEGRASQADEHGHRPTGVSVTNSLMMFYFGFKWGS